MAVVGSGDAVFDYLQNSVLKPGEVVRWTGRPGVMTCLLRGGVPFLFGLFFMCFSVFWTLGASTKSLYFALFGVPFILVGLVFVTAPFQFAFLATRTYYVVTDQRVIILTSFVGLRTRSYFAKDIYDLEAIDRGSDRGSIRLTNASVNRFGHLRQPTMATMGGGLWGIERFREAVRAVEDIKAARYGR